MKQDEYDILKTQVERAQRAAERARGAYDQSLRVLQEDFGLKSIEEAEAKLTVMEKSIQKKEIALKEAQDKLEKEWNEYQSAQNRD